MHVFVQRKATGRARKLHKEKSQLAGGFKPMALYLWGWPPHDCATLCLSSQWHIKTSLIKLVWNIIHWLVWRGIEEINPLLHCIAFRLESFNFWHLHSTLSGQREKWSQSATEMDLINLLWLVAKDCEGSANQMQSMYVVIYLFCPTLRAVNWPL